MLGLTIGPQLKTNLTLTVIPIKSKLISWFQSYASFPNLIPATQGQIRPNLTLITTKLVWSGFHGENCINVALSRLEFTSNHLHLQSTITPINMSWYSFILILAFGKHLNASNCLQLSLSTIICFSCSFTCCWCWPTEKENCNKLYQLSTQFRPLVQRIVRSCRSNYTATRNRARAERYSLQESQGCLEKTEGC